jgi:hypothetical protein
VRQAIALVALLLFVRHAEAKPMHLRLEDLRTQAKTVVVARYEGKLVLDVKRVITGNVRPGKLKVLASPDGQPDVPTGQDCVAFLDDKGRWRWAGRAVAGDVESGLLQIQGFYDSNAYLVSPSVMTVVALERFLAGQPLTWTFRGKLQGTAFTIEVTSTHGGASSVTGLPALAGFPAPQVLVSAGFGPHVTIQVDRNLNRPLSISGRVDSVGTDGTLATTFWLSEPSYLTQADFARYVADPKLGHPYAEIDVKLVGHEKPWRMVLDEEVGRIGKITVPEGTAPIQSVTLSPDPATIEAHLPGGRTLTLTLDALPPEPREGPGSDGGLVDVIQAGPIRCTASIPGQLSPTQCQLVLSAIRFVKL